MWVRGRWHKRYGRGVNILLLPQQRASSVGTTPRQGPVSPVNSVSSVGSGHSGSFPRGTYAPLSTENRVQPSVYATPDQHEVHCILHEVIGFLRE